jgi:hypothetical protein
LIRFITIVVVVVVVALSLFVSLFYYTNHGHFLILSPLLYS